MIRLYIPEPLSVGRCVRVQKDQKHYLEKVMRMDNVQANNMGKNQVSLFNNQDGEFLATYTSGVMTIIHQTRSFESLPAKILAFSLIKKHRLSWLLEKACELGVTQLYPLITKHVQFKDFKADRYERILIEAAEQSGRIDLPQLHPVTTIDRLPTSVQWHFGALLTSPTSFVHDTQKSTGFIVGPEGGFTKEEEDYLATFAKPVSMGPLILRSETAALWFCCRQTD